VHSARGIAEGDAGGEIKRYSHYRELPLVTDRQRCCRCLNTRYGAKRHLSSRAAERYLGAERRLSSRATARPLSASSAQRRLSAHGRAQVNMLQILQIILELRFDFQDNTILIRLCKYGRNLALAKGIVQHIVNRLHADAEAGRRITVDDNARLQAQVLVVTGNIPELRYRLRVLRKERGPARHTV